MNGRVRTRGLVTKSKVGGPGLAFETELSPQNGSLATRVSKAFSSPRELPPGFNVPLLVVSWAMRQDLHMRAGKLLAVGLLPLLACCLLSCKKQSGNSAQAPPGPNEIRLLFA